MGGTWQEALMLLHERAWHGDLIDEACEVVAEACLEGEFRGRSMRQLTADDLRKVLRHRLTPEEARALCHVAEVRGRSDHDGGQLREALRDLDAFADSLGET